MGAEDLAEQTPAPAEGEVPGPEAGGPAPEAGPAPEGGAEGEAPPPETTTTVPPDVAAQLGPPPAGEVAEYIPPFKASDKLYTEAHAKKQKLLKVFTEMVDEKIVELEQEEKLRKYRRKPISYEELDLRGEFTGLNSLMTYTD